MKTKKEPDNFRFIRAYNDYSIVNNVRDSFIVKFDFPNILEHTVFAVSERAIYLTLIAKKDKKSNASTLMDSICKLADEYDVDIYLEVMPVYLFDFKEVVISKAYAAQLRLQAYYERFGFQVLEKTQKLKTGYADIFMVRMANGVGTTK